MLLTINQNTEDFKSSFHIAKAYLNKLQELGINKKMHFSWDSIVVECYPEKRNFYLQLLHL